MLKGQFSTVNKATQQHQASVATRFPLGVNTFTTNQALSGGNRRAPGRDDSTAFSSCPDPRLLGPHPSQFPLLLAFWLLIILYREAGRLRADLSPRDRPTRGFRRRRLSGAPPDSPSIAQHHSESSSVAHEGGTGVAASSSSPSISQYHPASPTAEEPERLHPQHRPASLRIAQRRPASTTGEAPEGLRPQHRPASPSMAQHRPVSPSAAQYHPASPSITQHRLASPSIAQYRPASLRITQRCPVSPASPSITQNRPASPSVAQYHPASPSIA